MICQMSSGPHGPIFVSSQTYNFIFEEFPQEFWNLSPCFRISTDLDLVQCAGKFICCALNIRFQDTSTENYFAIPLHTFHFPYTVDLQRWKCTQQTTEQYWIWILCLVFFPGNTKLKRQNREIKYGADSQGLYSKESGHAVWKAGARTTTFVSNCWRSFQWNFHAVYKGILAPWANIQTKNMLFILHVNSFVFG